MLAQTTQDLPEIARQIASNPRLWASLLLIVLVFVGRVVLRRSILESELISKEEARLQWHQRIRNGSIVLLILGLVAIWGSELQSFALSAAAFAAAIVVATKELIMCIGGGVLRATSEGFKVGDRIEIGSLRGEVINLGFFTTTILEIGPASQRTGRAIVMPNSMLLSQPVTNETFTEDYVLHMFTLPWAAADWTRAERALLASARSVCQHHVEPAALKLNQVSRRFGLGDANVEPRVIVHITGTDEVTCSVRVPTPSREKGRHEQEIVRRFLAEMYPESIPETEPARIDPEGDRISST